METEVDNRAENGAVGGAAAEGESGEEPSKREEREVAKMKRHVTGIYH